jgi:hypothetical protein
VTVVEFVIVAWLVTSVPFGVVVGRAVRHGMGERPELPPRLQIRQRRKPLLRRGGPS